jgi:hypothetical protein
MTMAESWKCFEPGLGRTLTSSHSWSAGGASDLFVGIGGNEWVLYLDRSDGTEATGRSVMGRSMVVLVCAEVRGGGEKRRRVRTQNVDGET